MSPCSRGSKDGSGVLMSYLDCGCRSRLDRNVLALSGTLTDFAMMEDGIEA